MAKEKFTSKSTKAKLKQNVNAKKSRNFFYLVFIKIFSFLGGRLELTHVFSHSCPPFLDFFGQVMHFYKSL